MYWNETLHILLIIEIMDINKLQTSEQKCLTVSGEATLIYRHDKKRGLKEDCFTVISQTSLEYRVNQIF